MPQRGSEASQSANAAPSSDDREEESVVLFADRFSGVAWCEICLAMPIFLSKVLCCFTQPNERSATAVFSGCVMECRANVFDMNDDSKNEWMNSVLLLLACLAALLLISEIAFLWIPQEFQQQAGATWTLSGIAMMLWGKYGHWGE